MEPAIRRLVARSNPLIDPNLGRASRGKALFRPYFFRSSQAPLSFASSAQAAQKGNRNSTRRNVLVPACAAAIAVGVSIFAFSRKVFAESPSQPDSKVIRKFRLAEIQKHGKEHENPWVVRGNRVYDVTDWIPSHPGGDVALRAAGGNLDPYWQIFSIHQKQEVYDILEQYFIGVVDPEDLVDGQVPVDAIDDPFKNDPSRDKRLHQHTSRPCNAETHASDLAEYITPNELFYIRNHLWVPEASEAEHTLTVELYDGDEKVYTMEDLRSKFPQYKITATLQCSGNRRSHMTAGSYETNGLQWEVGAIGNAEWTGIKLRDVLEHAGLKLEDLDKDIKHAQFLGAEAYGASIPIEKAIDKRGDVLIAYEMNGQPLPLDHGFPLRIVVPGHVAARSVKWVNKITLSDEESTSQWQRRDYKCFGPNEGPKPDWDSAVAIQETPVQSAITNIRDVKFLGPMSEENRRMCEVFGLEEDYVNVEGYAFSGGGRRIVRVDISADNGENWNQAELIDSENPSGCKAWGWQRWRFGISQRQVGNWFLVKAVDEAYNTQPDAFKSHYNVRGNLASGWHRVPYKHAE